jgi:hypothetical protein
MTLPLRRRALIALQSVTDTGCTEPLIRWRGGVGAGRRPGAAPYRAAWLPNGSGRREQWPPFSSSSMTSTTRASASGSSTSRLSADERVTGPLTTWPARSAGLLCPAVRSGSAPIYPPRRWSGFRPPRAAPDPLGVCPDGLHVQQMSTYGDGVTAGLDPPSWTNSHACSPRWNPATDGRST